MSRELVVKKLASVSSGNIFRELSAALDETGDRSERHRCRGVLVPNAAFIEQRNVSLLSMAIHELSVSYSSYNQLRRRIVPQGDVYCWATAS